MKENRFNLSASAAENYQKQKVPALFGPMAEATLDAIPVPSRADVVDVACGTGAVARAVASRLAEPSHISGADLNPAMIEIAGAITESEIHAFDWQTAPADDMPFEDAAFDLAFCQQGLQFFPDKPAALAEIRRVLRTGGRMILTCWAGIPPFFETVSNILEQHIGKAAAEKAVQPFVWNNAGEIQALIEGAGFDCPPPAALPVMRVMPAAPEAMREEILATPNEPALLAAGDAVIDRIVAEILVGVERFREGETLSMPQVTHLFEARAC